MMIVCIYIYIRLYNSMELIMGSIWANSGVNNGGNDGAHNEFMTSS